MLKELVRSLLTGLLEPTPLGSAPGPSASDEPRRIHFEATLVDTHNDTIERVIDRTSWKPKNDLLDLNGQINLQKVQAGGLDVAFYAAYTVYQGNNDYFIKNYGYKGRTARTNSRMLALVNALYWSQEKNPELMTIATSLMDIEKGVRAGLHVAVPTLEGMYSFEDYNARELLQQYYDLGIRAATIVHNPANSLGAGTAVANDDPNAGLTELGREVIAEMNRLGIIVDVSHMNEKTFYDTLAVVKAPFIASHSGAAALRTHVRNLSDDQLVAIKAKGGVAQVNFWNTAVVPVGETATIARLVDHIDHIVKLIGIDHVGLGSDFDGASMPVDLPDASHLPKLTEELAHRGYSRQDMEKILGGNTLRVMKEVENLAEKATAAQGQDLTITPHFAMGAAFNDSRPRLAATIEAKDGSNIDVKGFRVVVDGLVYVPVFDQSTGILSCQVTEDLLGAGPLNPQGTLTMGGNYHMVSFEATNNSGQVTRETRIFYVGAGL